MPYRFALERPDYSDYSAGRVLYGQPGHPALPVRLASEMLQRCLVHRPTDGAIRPVVLFDPCCGGAYHLCTLAYLHWPEIGEIVGSDIDERALALAGRNLSLLTVEGLSRRVTELTRLHEAYGKPPHKAALGSAGRLQHALLENLQLRPIAARLFRADATDAQALRDGLQDREVDVVLTDVPYGRHSAWQGEPSEGAAPDHVGRMLGALHEVLAPTAIVAVAAPKTQQVIHPGFVRIERFQIGKRQIVLLRPAPLSG